MAQWQTPITTESNSSPFAHKPSMFSSKLGELERTPGLRRFMGWGFGSPGPKGSRRAPDSWPRRQEAAGSRGRCRRSSFSGRAEIKISSAPRILKASRTKLTLTYIPRRRLHTPPQHPFEHHMVGASEHPLKSRPLKNPKQRSVMSDSPRRASRRFLKPSMFAAISVRFLGGSPKPSPSSDLNFLSLS